jgi:hypothetical protein
MNMAINQVLYLIGGEGVQRLPTMLHAIRVIHYGIGKGDRGNATDVPPPSQPREEADTGRGIARWDYLLIGKRYVNATGVVVKLIDDRELKHGHTRALKLEVSPVGVVTVIFPSIIAGLLPEVQDAAYRIAGSHAKGRALPA